MSIPDDPIKLRAWLGTVSRHAAATYWRQKRRMEMHESLVLNENDNTGQERLDALVAPEAHNAFEIAEVRDWLSLLPERERRVLTGLFVLNMTEREVAMQMECNQSTVSRTKRKGISMLREQMMNDEMSMHKTKPPKRLER